MKKRIAALAVILVLMLALCGCGKADLYGSWAQKAQTPDQPDTLLTFFDNGTGTVAQGETVTWLYYEVKGKTVTVTMNEVGAQPTEYTFAVEDDTLTLTGEGDQVITLGRVVTTDA